jgi:tetratricopeptide (TPR) repeat protein
MPERLFQILLALVQSNGSVVARETLAQEVWGDEGVTDTNVNQHIYLLRLLLGERKGERSYIITIPGEGYRFAAGVSIAPEDEEQLVEDAVRSAARVLDVGDELFALYCRGSYLLDRRTASSLTAAAEAFEAALRINAEYVPALIGCARAHAMLAEYWHVPPAPAFATAKNAIARALRAEPRSSMAHAVQSEIQMFCDWDWNKSKRSLQTALALNPQSTFARNNAAWYYICSGEVERAMVEARQALLVEPASLPLQLLEARVRMHMGDYDGAIADMSNVLAADPDYYLARRYRAKACVLAGRPNEAIADLVGLAADASEDMSFRLPSLGCAYAQLGDPRATEIYDDMRARSATEYVSDRNIAQVAMALGREDEAVHYLQNGLSKREPGMLLLRTLPWFAPIEGRSDYRKIMREIGP